MIPPYVSAVNHLQNQSQVRCSPVLNPRHLHGWETRTLPDILQPNNDIYTRLFSNPTLPHSCAIWCKETHSWLRSPQAGILNPTFYREDSLKAPTHQEWSYRDPDESAYTLTQHAYPPYSSLAPGSISPPMRIEWNGTMNSETHLVGDFN